MSQHWNLELLCVFVCVCLMSVPRHVIICDILEQANVTCDGQIHRQMDRQMTGSEPYGLPADA